MTNWRVGSLVNPREEGTVCRATLPGCGHTSFREDGRLGNSLIRGPASGKALVTQEVLAMGIHTQLCCHTLDKNSLSNGSYTVYKQIRLI